MIYIIYELTMACLLVVGTYIGTESVALTIAITVLCLLWVALHLTIFKFEGVD